MSNNFNDKANSNGNKDFVERFTKMSDQLIGLGLPPRLVLLYGRLVYHAGKDGLCYPKWTTLAREVGLKDRTAVYRLLRQLKALKLVEWKRNGRYSNLYRPLIPDVAWLQRQTLRGCNVSDVASSQPIKEYIGVLKEDLKRGTSNPQGPPSHKPEPDLNICASADARIAESALAITPRSGDARDWFEQWWAIYWRRVARKDAEKAFRAAVKTPERFAQVMRATRAQTPMMMAREPDKQPYGATWLNAERWDDEVEAPATARKPPQASLVERTKALWAKRIAAGERPI